MQTGSSAVQISQGLKPLSSLFFSSTRFSLEALLCNPRKTGPPQHGSCCTSSSLGGLQDGNNDSRLPKLNKTHDRSPPTRLLDYGCLNAESLGVPAQFRNLNQISGLSRGLEALQSSTLPLRLPSELLTPIQVKEKRPARSLTAPPLPEPGFCSAEPCGSLVGISWTPRCASKHLSAPSEILDIGSPVSTFLRNVSMSCSKDQLGEEEVRCRHNSKGAPSFLP